MSTSIWREYTIYVRDCAEMHAALADANVALVELDLEENVQLEPIMGHGGFFSIQMPFHIGTCGSNTVNTLVNIEEKLFKFLVYPTMIHETGDDPFVQSVWPEGVPETMQESRAVTEMFHSVGFKVWSGTKPGEALAEMLCQCYDAQKALNRATR